MAALTASDILPSNLLSELNLNPMWEKIRGYSLAGSIAISLSTLYMTLNGVDVHCVPVHNSSTGKNQALHCTTIADGELSGPQTAYVNSQCATDEKLWLQRYAGAIMLGIAIVILIVSSFWLHINKVKDGIRTFAHARDKFLELSEDEAIKFCPTPIKGIQSDHACPEEAEEILKALMKKTDFNTEAHKTVREVIRLFAYHKPENSMLTWYLIRNILLLIVALITVGYLIGKMTLTDQLAKDFNCTTDGRSGIPYEKFICTSKYSHTIYLYLWMYCGTVILQLYMSGRATYVCYPKDYFRNLSETFRVTHLCHPKVYFHSLLKGLCAEKCNRSPGLLMKFWESATPSHTRLFENIIRRNSKINFAKMKTTNLEGLNQAYSETRRK